MHKSLTLLFCLYLYTLLEQKGRTVTLLLHQLFLGELHRYDSGYKIVCIPFEQTIACSILRPISEVASENDTLYLSEHLLVISPEGAYDAIIPYT